MNTYLVMLNYARADEILKYQTYSLTAAIDHAQWVADTSPVTDTVEVISYDSQGQLIVHWKTVGRLVPRDILVQQWPDEPQIWEY